MAYGIGHSRTHILQHRPGTRSQAPRQVVRLAEQLVKYNAMGLDQQLAALKGEFLRTAPSGRPALHEAEIEELRTRSGREACAWGPRSRFSAAQCERHARLPPRSAPGTPNRAGVLPTRLASVRNTQSLASEATPPQTNRPGPMSGSPELTAYPTRLKRAVASASTTWLPSA